MGSFARKRGRDLKKKAHTGDKRAVRDYRQARQAVKESMVNQLKRDHKCRRESIHNIMACFLMTMHESYGFGRERLLRLRDKMQSEFDAIVAGNVSVEEIAGYLKSELDLDIDILEKDPNAGHYRQIEFKVIQQMSSSFLMALLDEFGFKKKRLENAYGYVIGLSNRLDKKEMDFPELCAKVDAVINRGKGAKNNGEKAA